MNNDVFISHHTDSSLHIVRAIVNKLESNNIKCWYAPRDTEGDYAGSIANAIEECRIFLLILNKDASESPHVLNELNLVTERLSKREEVNIIPFHISDNDISSEAKHYIGRMHWIDAMTPPMYKRVDELVDKIAGLLDKNISDFANKKENKGYKLISKIPQVRNVFYGREDILSEINRIFESGNRVLFLEGVGGIGKSEISKQYVLQNRETYDNIVFVTYSNSIKNMVCDSNIIEIENLVQREDNIDAFFAQKMQIIRTLCDEKTIFIIDNFDVDNDEDFSKFIEGRHRVILTTRNEHRGYPCVKVGPIQDEETLHKIFEQNYGGSIDEVDKIWIEKLFKKVENHTYMIELLAKQMDASFLSAEEMYNLLTEGRLEESAIEHVEGRSSQRTVFEHLESLFNISVLSDEERYVLQVLSLMGTGGVSAKRFREWTELNDMSMVNDLIHRSWIRKESGQLISIHPLVAQVVLKCIPPTTDSFFSCLKNMAVFSHDAWGRVYKENLDVTENICTVLKYFEPFDATLAEYFEPMISVLWQVGRFDDSIKFGHKLYESCLKDFGEANVTTGVIAKSLGGAYFNARRLQESVPWYEQGLKSLELSGVEYSVDLTIAYEKVARCYTWDFNFSPEQAEKYFAKALELKNLIRQHLERGGKVNKFNTFKEYTIESAEQDVGIYFEIGRLYQKQGKYIEAQEWAERYKETLEEYNLTENPNYAYALYDIGICYYYWGVEYKKSSEEKFPNLSKEYFEKAIAHLNAALLLNMKKRGEIANDTIDTQEYLGDVYVALEKYGEASNAYMSVINMLENLYGENYERIEKVKNKMMF